VSDARASPQKPHPSQSAATAVAVFGLLALTAAVRLPGITRPLLGNFATKNVIHAMIARNWIEGRAGILYPSLDCLVGGGRSLHMLEFSVSAYLTGGLWALFGGSLDVWGRATSVVFSVASVAVLFLLARRWHGTTAAFGAAFVLALSPISIIYGQSFMLDPSLVFFTLMSFYGLDRWLEVGGWAWLLAGGCCFALLLLTKVYMVVLLLPLGMMVLRGARPASRPATEEGPRRPRYALAVVAALLAVLPVFLWSLHALRAAAPESPHAAHVFASLQGNAASYRPPDPLLRTPDFYRQLLDDLTGVILTPLGFALLLFGFLDRGWRRHAAWLVAMGILVAALPRKFYAMNYYYMAVLPPLCVVAGLGWKMVGERLRPGRLAVAGLVLVALALAMRYAVKPAFVTPEEDRAVVAAGQAIQQWTDEDEPIATMHGTAIDLLYYADRPGWAIDPDTPDLAAALEECRRQGARFFVVAGCEAASNELETLDGYEPVARGDGYRIWRLEEK
jgi:4-amino-4-deoxy-L-arabinose transferase-like glycosyltransferase